VEQVQDLQNQLQQQGKELQEANQKIELMWAAFRLFFQHPGDPNAKYYHLTTTGPKSAKLVRQGVETGSYNFVNGAEILPQQRMKYTVTITKTTESRDLMIGFCTIAGVGKEQN
jgi:hypothetical protein